MSTAAFSLLALLLGAAFGYAIAALRAAVQLERARSESIRLQTQLETLAAAREELANQFQVLAGRILDAQSQKFTAQNREALLALLGPLGERIADFKQKVETVHTEDLKQRSALKQQVELLAEQSQAVGQKADQLAVALKGDNKAVGNWGELVLERLLESAGLQKGRDFDLQVSAASADGRFQPDAVVRLPENRCLVIDSKMSLKDYADHAAAADAPAREAAPRAFRRSLGL